MNITDVGHLTSDADTGEDKMEKGSLRTGKTAWEIAEFYAQAFMADMQALNIDQPHIWCKATDHILEQIEVIRCIEEKGFTYITSDGVYFDTSRLPDYGALGKLDIEGLQAGTRIDMGEKRHPTDFALWKFSPSNKQRQMEWESPWGKGFPGWHIECSAMSAKYLGSFFDIHCGGEDHITVHHTNEIAQTEACYGTHLANFWMHGYFLQLDEAKMSKSSGEFLRIQTLVEQRLRSAGIPLLLPGRPLPCQAQFWLGRFGQRRHRLGPSAHHVLRVGRGRDDRRRVYAAVCQPGKRRPEHAARPGSGLGPGTQQPACFHQESHPAGI